LALLVVLSADEEEISYSTASCKIFRLDARRDLHGVAGCVGIQRLCSASIGWWFRAVWWELGREQERSVSPTEPTNGFAVHELNVAAKPAPARAVDNNPFQAFHVSLE